jgi:hypothetical protein
MNACNTGLRIDQRVPQLASAETEPSGKAPGRVRRMLRAIGPLRFAVHAAREVLGRYLRPVWLLEGNERGSGLPLRVLFAGQLENMNYLAHLAFAPTPVKTSLGRRGLWRLLPPGTTWPLRGADLLFLEMPERLRRRYEKRFEFFIPSWVGGEVDLAHARERWQRSRHAKEDLRRMRNRQMTIEVTRDAAAFEMFYSQMYLPYIRTTYGDRAFLMSREDMVAAHDHAELVFLKVHGEAVIGQIVLYERTQVRAWSRGVKDGDRAHLKGGTMNALDYLLFQYLTGQGHRSVHMGASRPFLCDGVLNYKKRLGMRITDHGGRWLALRYRADSPGARSFLAGNPFIHADGQRLKGAVFGDPVALGSEQACAHYCAQYEIAGLSKTALFPLAGTTAIGAVSSRVTENAGEGEGHSAT